MFPYLVLVHLLRLVPFVPCVHTPSFKTLFLFLLFFSLSIQSFCLLQTVSSFHLYSWRLFFSWKMIIHIIQSFQKSHRKKNSFVCFCRWCTEWNENDCFVQHATALLFIHDTEWMWHMQQSSFNELTLLVNDVSQMKGKKNKIRKRFFPRYFLQLLHGKMTKKMTTTSEVILEQDFSLLFFCCSSTCVFLCVHVGINSC